MTKYYLIVASKDHVLKGVEGNFAQAGHGRKDLISKPSQGDWIIYYSSKENFEDRKPFQRFTALGKIVDIEPYQPGSANGIKPYRREVKYSKSKEADIRPLIDRLSFIKNKTRWGFYLIGGFREITQADFEMIKTAME